MGVIFCWELKRSSYYLLDMCCVLGIELNILNIVIYLIFFIIRGGSEVKEKWKCGWSKKVFFGSICYWFCEFEKCVVVIDYF